MTVSIPERCSPEVGKSAVAEVKFKELATEWKNATVLDSRVKDIVYHIAYQKIIGMGPVAVPFILNDLIENGPEHWFWALRVITDENPISKEMSGNMAAMTEAWLQWGKRKGYLNDYPKPMSASSQT